MLESILSMIRKPPQRTIFEPMTVVVFDPGDDPEPSYYNSYPLKKGDLCIWLGEHPNAHGHGIVAKCGENNPEIQVCSLYWMFHPELFRLPTEEEF